MRFCDELPSMSPDNSVVYVKANNQIPYVMIEHHHPLCDHSFGFCVGPQPDLLEVPRLGSRLSQSRRYL